MQFACTRRYQREEKQRRYYNAFCEIAAILGLAVTGNTHKMSVGKLSFLIKKYFPELTEEDFDPQQNFQTKTHHGISPRTVFVLRELDLEIPKSWMFRRVDRTYRSNLSPFQDKGFVRYNGSLFRFALFAWERLGKPKEVERLSFTKQAFKIATSKPYSLRPQASAIDHSCKGFLWLLLKLGHITKVTENQENKDGNQPNGSTSET